MKTLKEVLNKIGDESLIDKLSRYFPISNMEVFKPIMDFDSLSYYDKYEDKEYKYIGGNEITVTTKLSDSNSEYYMESIQYYSIYDKEKISKHVLEGLNLKDIVLLYGTIIGEVILRDGIVKEAGVMLPISETRYIYNIDKELQTEKYSAEITENSYKYRDKYIEMKDNGDYDVFIYINGNLLNVYSYKNSLNKEYSVKIEEVRSKYSYETVETKISESTGKMLEKLVWNTPDDKNILKYTKNVNGYIITFCPSQMSIGQPNSQDLYICKFDNNIDLLDIVQLISDFKDLLA